MYVLDINGSPITDGESFSGDTLEAIAADIFTWAFRWNRADRLVDAGFLPELVAWDRESFGDDEFEPRDINEDIVEALAAHVFDLSISHVNVAHAG